MRRLYYVLSNKEETRQLVDALLLKRVCYHHMHVVAKEGSDLNNLPESGILIQKDVFHSLLTGGGIGAVVGVVSGIIGHGVLSLPIGGGLIVTTLLGMLLGAWCASMYGLMTPNTYLKRFNQALETGHYLLIVDLPKARIKEIEGYIQKDYPTACHEGIEATVPPFP